MNEFDLPDMPRVRKYQLTELRERHKEILRQKMLGASNTDIAENLGITSIAVGYTLHGELAQEQMRDMQQIADIDTVDVAHEIKIQAPKAVRLLSEIIDGSHPDASISLRMRAATEILDRAGHGKVTKVEGRFAHGYMDQQGLDLIRARAREIGLATGNIVEVSPSQPQTQARHPSLQDEPSEVALDFPSTLLGDWSPA